MNGGSTLGPVLRARKTRSSVSKPPDYPPASLDRGKAELEVLRALTNGSRGAAEYRLIVRLVHDYRFCDAEYQIVFESLREISENEPISFSRLAVHLNNRGFPDIDLEKYFEGTPVDLTQGMALARTLLISIGKIG